MFNRLPLHPQVNSIIGDFTVLELFNYVDDFGLIVEALKKTKFNKGELKYSSPLSNFAFV